MAYCGKCLHLDVCKTADSCDGHVPGCKHFMDKTAISEALEKQEPKKTLWGGDNRTSWRSCPTCHSRMHNTCKYCSQCGQSLDWRK